MQSESDINIRDFILGDEATLREVFMSSIHELACDFYTVGQLSAWAPNQYDEQEWAKKIRSLRPFIATINSHIIGYADLQTLGHIDHFFVAGGFSKQGVGAALIQHIHQVAAHRKITTLSANVSLAAESFFLKQGFAVMQRQLVKVRGETLRNAQMVKSL